MFGFLKEKITNTYRSIIKGVSSIFSRGKIDEQFWQELRKVLLTADTGAVKTREIIEVLKKRCADVGCLGDAEAVKSEFAAILEDLLAGNKDDFDDPKILLLVGVNGSGKTSFAGKFAARLKKQGKKVLLVAGDTFRAAAQEQLQEWGAKTDVEVLTAVHGSDPASVVFDGCSRFVEGGFDHLIIDTAGRLQTKQNLMAELSKIRRVIEKKLKNESVTTWLTIDAMMGQNTLEQAKLFHESTPLDGAVLTKLDGTGRGGIVFSVADCVGVWIRYISVGESVSAIERFDVQNFVRGMLDG